MSRSQITFTLGQGNIANPATGTDYISGIHFYGSAPGSFATTACQAVFSLSDAESKGITADYLDETQPTGTYVISAKGNTGDIITVTVTELLPNGGTSVITLATYKIPSGDNSIALQGAALKAAINANTYLNGINGMTGYTATFDGTATITLTARVGTGIQLNSGSPITVTAVGHTTPWAGTPTQFSGGVYSQKAIWNYHISEFFRANPNSQLWVRFAASPASDYSDVQALQTAAAGSCMRIAVYSFVTKAVADVATDLNLLQAQADDLFAAYQPAAMFYAPNIAAVSDISTLENLQSVASAESCYCVISQDGAAAGAQLFVNSGVSITNVGCVLGTSSAAAVSQDIGEIGAFNLSNGIEMNVPAFSNGVLVSSVATSLLDILDAYRYGFCVNMTGYPGTFVNNDWTAMINTNAYNRLGRILTIYKLERQQYIALLPLLKSRIYLNADGTMTQTTIEQYTGAAEPRIEQMVKDGDISPGNITGTALTTGVVSIDPTQNVNSQGYIAIVYNILGVSIADSINVTLQFTQKLS